MIQRSLIATALKMPSVTGAFESNRNCEITELGYQFVLTGQGASCMSAFTFNLHLTGSRISA